MSHHTPKLPPDWLLQRISNSLTYNHLNGHLIWTNPLSNKLKPGDIAGSIGSKGYMTVTFRYENKSYTIFVHHICWFLYYGKWPSKQIDHKRGNKLDNRIKRLRKATTTQNISNRGLQINNTSGVTGVRWYAKYNKWRAEIQYKTKHIHLGLFNTLSGAKKARRKAERKYFGKFRYKK